MSEHLSVFKTGAAVFKGEQYRCALGRSGVTRHKREGDNRTPLGSFPLREVLYRGDRIPKPRTGLPCRALTVEDGWCDDPTSPDYNRLVQLPHPARHESLWRADRLYDLIIVVGYNDDPVVPQQGSAIFVHLARDGYAGTEGCIGFKYDDLVRILAGLSVGSRVVVKLPPSD